MTDTPPPRQNFEPWDDTRELTEADLREIGRAAARELRAILWKKAEARKRLAGEPGK